MILNQCSFANVVALSGCVLEFDAWGHSFRMQRAINQIDAVSPQSFPKQTGVEHESQAMVS